MSASLALIALSSFAGNMGLAGNAGVSAVQPSAPPPAAAESDPVRAAREWLALIDKGDWTASWNATGQSFKALNTVDVWAKLSEQVRPPLGAVQSRVLISEQDVPAPPYGYRMVKFRTDYANKPGAIETLSLSREGEQWRVVGVTIE